MPPICRHKLSATVMAKRQQAGRILSRREFEKVLRSISDYESIAKQIIDYCTKGEGKGRSYRRLAELCSKYGPRFSGTQTLEDSIDFMLAELSAEGLENVRGEQATASKWIRNQEYAQLVAPFEYNFAISGCGSSIPTAAGGLEEDAIVLTSFEEMEERKDEVKGKIVVFNQEWKGYENTATYRNNGAAKAAKCGAVAVLIRSLTPVSLYTLHTGWQDYVEGVPKIPSACIAVEDAETFARLQADKKNLKIRIVMNCANYADVKSRNTVAEIKGSQFPQQVVVIGGHLDCWDVCMGSMDDGGGAFISREALSVIRDLKLPRPKRTIRMCMFTSEESNFGGSIAFYDKYKNDAEDISILMESDSGTFTPTGLSFLGSEQARVIMKEIGKLLESINASYVSDGSDLVAPDFDIWVQNESNVPVGSLLNKNENYFWYHHSGADTMNVQNPDEMDLCTAVWAVYAYVLADLDSVLPRP